MFIVCAAESSAAFLIRQMVERISLDLIFMNSIGWILQEVFLMKYVFLLFIGLWVLGCKSPEATKGHMSRTQQVLVEAKFFEG